MDAVYFVEGATADMGIFDGYGAGYYFNIDDREYGPYDTKVEAQNIWAETLAEIQRRF